MEKNEGKKFVFVQTLYNSVNSFDHIIDFMLTTPHFDDMGRAYI